MAFQKPYPKTVLILLILSFSFFGSFSQSTQHYSLLWKITGNGLTKPSYLFGTMHVKDKRVFHFSDSVMLSLQSCDRFALEVHPDTLMSVMFASLQKTDTSRSVEKLLDSTQYKLLAKKFEKKHGYPMGKIDPMILESLMEPDEEKPDDKISFIDAYLFGIARTLNKDVFGLEDAGSQYSKYFGSNDEMKEKLLELLDDNVEAYTDSATEEMIRIYSTGDLDSIYKYTLDNRMQDTVIAARNRVMAGSMVKDMAGTSLFAAVGAAHLPGPDGVISLLRKAGYQVTKVGASFTGVASAYHIDYMKMNWPVFKYDALGYSLNFPGTPIRFKVNGLTFIIYPDIANDIYYGIYAVKEEQDDVPAKRKTVISQLINNITQNKKNVILDNKQISFNNKPCTQLLIKTSSGFTKVRYLLENNILYVLYADSKQNHLTGPLVNRFFDSFENHPIAQSPQTPWLPYTNNQGAFHVEFPLKPDTIIKQIPQRINDKDVNYTLNIFSGTDTIKGGSYLVRYNDYPLGYYLKDKTELLTALIAEFNTKGKVIGTPLKIYSGETEGREFNTTLNGGFNARVRVFLKGNRTYLLMKQINPDELSVLGKSDKFFDSFKLIPCINPDYYTYIPADSAFKVLMVSKPKVSVDSAKNYTNYLNQNVSCYSTNPNSGGSYGFEYSKISPYLRIVSKDSLYRKIIKSIVGYRDSVTKTDTVNLSGLKAIDYTIIKKETNYLKRVRLLIDGDKFYCFTGHMDVSELFNTTGNTIFSSLSIAHNNTRPYDYASSKAQRIFKDLKSDDTLVFNAARGALSFYNFDKKELLDLYTALKNNYRDDSLADGARGMLIKVLITLNDSAAVNNLVKLYNNTAGKDNLHATILNTIPQIDKKNGYNIYLNLLTSNPPYKADNIYYVVFYPLTDSVGFAASHFEQLLPLIKNKNFRSSILRVANDISNPKNDSYNKLLNKTYTQITAFAMDDLSRYLAIKDSTNNEWAVCIYNYMLLMEYVKSHQINDRFTKEYIDNDPNGAYASDAVIARIYNGLPNKPFLIAKFLDSIDTRYEIMESYNSLGKLNMVPLKYRSQLAFAKLNFYKYVALDGDYGNPKEITLLGNIVKNGFVYYVFKYKLPEMEEGVKLIGIAGPYKSGSNKLNFEKYSAYTNYDHVKLNWRLQASKMIQQLKQAYK